MLGTNPIAFAAPAGEETDFVLDMATSTVASGKIGLARRLGVPIPAGWAVDAEGDAVTEPPGDRGEHWAQNPLGNTREQGAHKGYGLAMMVDILCGVLSGGGYSSFIGGGKNMSFAMAIDIAAFRPVDEFKAMMDEMIQALHDSPTEPGADRVLVAGDPEEEAARDRDRQWRAHSSIAVRRHRRNCTAHRGRSVHLGCRFTLARFLIDRTTRMERMTMGAGNRSGSKPNISDHRRRFA